MVAHLDDLGRRHDIEPLGRAPFGCQDGTNLLLVAEQHDATLRPDGVKRHDGTLDGRFGSEIATHGIYTYF